ncbi:MAG: hypothetical protein Q4A65_06375 [Bacillota bacterium]|nr:hypothetical protein [Bacillota bacterium]
MNADRFRKHSNTRFIVELFTMFLLLLVVIVVITMVGITARSQSLEANALTKAVICAGNTAEITHDASSAKEAASLIKQMDGASGVSVSGDSLSAQIDGFNIEIDFSSSKGSAGDYIDKIINVYQDGGEAIYTLHAGKYKGSEQ